MKTVIKINNKVCENSIITVDTLNSTAYFDTMDTKFINGWRELNLSDTFIEINIFGSMENFQ